MCPLGRPIFPKKNDIHQASKRHGLRSSSVTRDERLLSTGMVETHLEGNELPSQQGNPSHSLNTFCLDS